MYSTFGQKVASHNWGPIRMFCSLAVLDLRVGHNMDVGLHSYYLAKSYSFVEYWIHFKARFDGLHAAGYNSAESETIWMKFGTL